jgi:hypothetical protein
MNRNKRVLYITYDGLTDPLGQSQILPYLVGLAKEGYKFTILSFEKKDRYEKKKGIINKITSEAGIEWVPLSFTSRPPVLSKLYDAVRMRMKAFRLQRKNKFAMVHCRSYIAADIGLRMKKRYGTKFFFDMRGFWADEKKDGGSWNQGSLLFRKIYRHYKKKEAEFIQQADHIISLTEAGRNEIMKWPTFNSKVSMTVIPCCSDMDLFSLVTSEERLKARQLLGLPVDKMVLSYLGSIGAWYMLDEMVMLFRAIRQQYPGAFFLFVTHSDKMMILDKLNQYDVPVDAIKIIEASRQEVPLYIKASDMNVSFIKPVYSKLSSSPTKLGEVLAMGIPVITNAGVGDVEQVVLQSKGGIAIHEFTEAEYERVVKSVPGLLAIDPAGIRKNIYDIYDLRQGVNKYLKAYKKTLENEI